MTENQNIFHAKLFIQILPDCIGFVNEVEEAVAEANEKLAVIIFRGEEERALLDEFVESVHDAHHVRYSVGLTRQLEENCTVETLEESFQRRSVV